MIKIENTEIVGWQAAIRGMRNPLESWDKSDSFWETVDYDSLNENDIYEYKLGPNDLGLMKRLSNAGTDHRKFMRMIVVYCDILAPLYWWKEFDTYKVGTVRNSCSTMHCIHKEQFILHDFSHEHLNIRSMSVLKGTIAHLNEVRNVYMYGGFDYDENGEWIRFEPKNKYIWWQMIQLLPDTYNQRATVMLNYEVLANMYKSRKDHRLWEWHTFCDWIRKLPYSELITGEEQKLEYADQTGLALGC